MDKRQSIEGVVRSLRRVNFQGSIFGQSVAVRFGLSDSDIDALMLLIDRGASTAGRLSELMGLTSGAVTRVIDRLEQAGYVRRTTDPADRRRVVIEVVPERAANIESLLGSLGKAAAVEADRYTAEQLAVIDDFLARMADLTEAETTRVRTVTDEPTTTAEAATTSEHAAPLAGLASARLMFRSGIQVFRLRTGRDSGELYRAKFEGMTPQVRVRDGRVLISYRGGFFDWRKRVATIGLNATIPWSIDIVGGMQRFEADLRDIEVEQLEVKGGCERFQLELGRPKGEGRISIVGGVKTVRIERPAGVPTRVRTLGGIYELQVDGVSMARRAGEATAESSGWRDATDRYLVEIIGGAKSVTVVERA